MGPPLKAAENVQRHLDDGLRRCAASMGPPLKAAENSRRRATTRSLTRGFNGAAAKSSGKYGVSAGVGAARVASMGPPLKAAENPRRTPHTNPRFRGFNGAAAKSSGK